MLYSYGAFKTGYLHSFGKFILKVEKIFPDHFDLDSAINGLLDKYNFVKEEFRQNLIEDIKLYYAVEKNVTSYGINNLEFIKFKADRLTQQLELEKAENELLQEINY